MTGNFRLSRISHPRSNLWAMLLLVVVFLCFGLVAQAYVPSATTISTTTETFKPVQSQ